MATATVTNFPGRKTNYPNLVLSWCGIADFHGLIFVIFLPPQTVCILIILFLVWDDTRIWWAAKNLKSISRSLGYHRAEKFFFYRWRIGFIRRSFFFILDYVIKAGLRCHKQQFKPQKCCTAATTQLSFSLYFVRHTHKHFEIHNIKLNERYAKDEPQKKTKKQKKKIATFFTLYGLCLWFVIPLLKRNAFCEADMEFAQLNTQMPIALRWRETKEKKTTVCV